MTVKGSWSIHNFHNCNATSIEAFYYPSVEHCFHFLSFISYLTRDPGFCCICSFGERVRQFLFGYAKTRIKRYQTNVWHEQRRCDAILKGSLLRKPIIFHFSIHLTIFVVAILVKFYCFTNPFVPNLEAKSVIPELTTRDIKYSWWSLLGRLRFITYQTKANTNSRWKGRSPDTCR